MSQTLLKIRKLIAAEHMRISDHGYDELSNDNLLFEDVLASVEDYMRRKS